MSQFTESRADAPVLRGALVRLEPLRVYHRADLALVAEEDRGSYGFTTVPRAGEMDDYLAMHFDRAKREGSTPFAQVRLSDERAVGVTARHADHDAPDLVGDTA